MIASAVQQVEAGESLAQEQMFAVMEAVMEGRCPEEEIARLLSALHQKGETVAEVAGGGGRDAKTADADPEQPARASSTPAGTGGGDGSRTFNISTAAALVVAAAGVPVAKHGNRSITSRSGSADVLAALGVNVQAEVARVEACLDELGICFCFAPLLHQAMRHVAVVRKRLGTPTIFNILGPLANPASATFQLLGVGKAPLRPLLAEALSRLEPTPDTVGLAPRAVVVHGDDGLDEVTLTGPTQATESAGGQLREFTWTPEDFGIPRQSLAAIQVEGPEQSAAMIRDVFANRPGTARDIVVLNAAAALWTVCRADTPAACARLAAETLAAGAPAELLAPAGRADESMKQGRRRRGGKEREKASLGRKP